MKNIAKKTLESATQSWRTTIGGIVAGTGLALLCLVLLPDWGWKHPDWIKECGTTGLILTVAGVIILGVHAADHQTKADK